MEIEGWRCYIIPMNRFLNYVRYHYKAFFAILFSVIGLCLLLASTVYDIVAGTGISFSLIWNYLFYFFVFFIIMIGNVNGKWYAYTGILFFIFAEVLSLILDSIQIPNLMQNVIASGDASMIVLMLSEYIILSGVIFTGIFTYIQIQRYLRGRYANYSGVRNWTLAFSILCVISSTIAPIFYYFIIGDATILLLFLTNFAKASIAVSIFFTVTRLKSEY